MERFEEILSRKGVAITSSRLAVLRAISQSKDHPNVEKIHERARNYQPNIGIATVYRNVSLLTDLGLVDRLSFNSDQFRYEISSEDSQHDHLINIETGDVVEFYEKAIDDALDIVAKKHG